MTHSESDTNDKPLVDKLGFTAGDSIFVETTPDWYSQFANDHKLDLTPDLPADHAHLFFAGKDELREFLDAYNLNDVAQAVWFSWPKKSSGIKSDLQEQSFRDLILPLGWVDIKVVAIDDTWSALKFVRRKSR